MDDFFEFSCGSLGFERVLKESAPELLEAKFSHEGFVISRDGIEEAPREIKLPKHVSLRRLDPDSLEDIPVKDLSAVDIGCGYVRQCCERTKQERLTVTHFYRSDSGGKDKCTNLLRTLASLSSSHIHSKFVLALEGACYDPFLDRVLVLTQPAEHGSLREIVGRCGAPPPAITSALVRKLLDALIWLHWERGLVHNGLTSYNVLVDGQGRVRLAGLQLACVDRERINATDPELCVLTHGGDPTFIAPERCAHVPPHHQMAHRHYH